MQQDLAFGEPLESVPLISTCLRYMSTTKKITRLQGSLRVVFSSHREKRNFEVSGLQARRGHSKVKLTVAGLPPGTTQSLLQTTGGDHNHSMVSPLRAPFLLSASLAVSSIKLQRTEISKAVWYAVSSSQVANSRMLCGYATTWILWASGELVSTQRRQYSQSLVPFGYEVTFIWDL